MRLRLKSRGITRIIMAIRALRSRVKAGGTYPPEFCDSTAHQDCLNYNQRYSQYPSGSEHNMDETSCHATAARCTRLITGTRLSRCENENMKN